MGSQKPKYAARLQQMPRHRLRVQQFPLLLRSTLHPTIIPNNTYQRADRHAALFRSLLGRLEQLCTRARASDVTAAHFPAALNYAHLLAMVGRLDDAAAQVADGTQQARREGNAMALDSWATIDGVVHLTAGRLSAARAATESLPRPQRTGVTPLDMLRMVILAEVAVRTDDRNLLQQTVNDAHDAYPGVAHLS